VRSYVTCLKNIAVMILLKYVYNVRSIVKKERRRCEDNHGEKIAMIQLNNVQLNEVQLLISEIEMLSD